MSKLSTRSMCVFFGRRRVLGPLDVSFSENRLTALIGPKRSGKTTLLRAFNRLLDERAGARVEGWVMLDEQDIYLLDPLVLKQRVGMVLPEPTPFAGSIWDNVTYGLRLRGVRDKAKLVDAVEKALREVNLWDYRDKLQHRAVELTIEQQQRLCIARVLALEPEILLLDEPFNQIDAGSRSHLEGLVQELRTRYTVIAAISNMELASRISDEIAFVLDGQIVEFGPTEELFFRPKDKRTGDFITGRLG